MAKRLTPIERFIAEIPPDRRRRHDAKQLERGLVRVTVTVPVNQTETVKTFARLLRNDPEGVEIYRRWLSDYLEDHYRDFDEWVAAGEPE